MQQTQNKSKPNPKSEKNQKKDRKSKDVIETPSAGKHQPFAALDIVQEATKKEANEKAAQEAKRVEDKQKKKEADDKAKRANIYSYLDDVKKRHPSLPAELLDGIKNSKTAGEGKRLLKDYLIKRDAAQQPV